MIQATTVAENVRVEDLFPGQSAEKTTIITKEIAVAFADVSGDYNPVHTSEEYAATTQFREPIAHGALLGSYISAMIGTELPGPGTIVLALDLKFPNPVKLGTEVTTRVQVETINSRRGFVKLLCVCTSEGKTVVKGEALVMVLRLG